MQVGLSHVVGGLVALILIVGGAFTVGAKWDSQPEANAAGVTAALEDDSATSSEEFSKETEEDAGEELFDVIKVVDGDTIAVTMNGKSETIRLIGIDTPETVDPRTTVQCFGKEATAKLKSIIGKRVAIERDEREGERDKYDRLLAYIHTADGLFINKYLIEQGFAYEYTYDDPYKYQKEFKAAQAAAKAAKRGLWAPNACPEPTKAVPVAVKAVVAPAQTPIPAPATSSKAQIKETTPEPEKPTEPTPEPKKEAKKAEPDPKPADTSGYTCSSNKYNCTDFKTHAEAQAVFDQCGGAENDIHKLDNNKDGEACESLP